MESGFVGIAPALMDHRSLDPGIGVPSMKSVPTSYCAAAGATLASKAATAGHRIVLDVKCEFLLTRLRRKTISEITRDSCDAATFRRDALTQRRTDRSRDSHGAVPW